MARLGEIPWTRGVPGWQRHTNVPQHAEVRARFLGSPGICWEIMVFSSISSFFQLDLYFVELYAAATSSCLTEASPSERSSLSPLWSVERSRIHTLGMDPAWEGWEVTGLAEESRSCWELLLHCHYLLLTSAQCGWGCRRTEISLGARSGQAAVLDRSSCRMSC